MTFQIDTGTQPDAAKNWRFDRVEILIESIRDELGDDATQAQIDNLVVQYVTGELRQPKTLATVRRRLLQYWPLIAPLADREPEQFDAIILEFAEISTSLG